MDFAQGDGSEQDGDPGYLQNGGVHVFLTIRLPSNESRFVQLTR